MRRMHLLIASTALSTALGIIQVANAQVSPPVAAGPATASPTTNPGATSPGRAAGVSAESPPVAPQGGSTLGEVVVTARRRAENLQTVPVNVEAFGAQALQQQNITTTQDLAKATPGVVFTSAGTTENSTYSIRGQGTFVTGASIPSVISYVNEVPLPAYGSVVPTYDVNSIQVLKGPQGTLFGRNTTGGAVLVYTTPPSYKFGGYLEGQYGSYDGQDFQGAVNVPLVDDKLAVRIAADYTRRGGYTENLGPGGNLDDLDSRKYRMSLLAEPVDGLKNVLVYDYYHSNVTGPGVVPIGSVANPEYDLLQPFFACGVSPTCDVGLAQQIQNARGPRIVDSDIAPHDIATIQTITNTTTYQLPYSLTFKNIFGYHAESVNTANNTDGLALAELNDLQTEHHDHQFSDEVQFSGDLLDKSLNYLFGGFYVNDRPSGSNSLELQILAAPPFFPGFGSQQNAFYTDQSRAAFFNLNYDIGKVVSFLHGLKLDGGFRYTWDSEGVCAQTAAQGTDPLGNINECRGAVGAFNDKANFSAGTYSVSLDYQLNRNVFLYFTNRRGYRSGNINDPELGGTLAQFQTFQPQTVMDYEIGAKTEWTFHGVAGRFNIDGFNDRYRNLQRNITGIPPNTDGDNNANDDPANTALTINGAVATITGFEYDGVISPFQGLQLTYNGSYLSPHYDFLANPAALSGIAGTGGEFENTPRWSYTFGGRYELPFHVLEGGLFLNASYYHEDSYLVGVATVPGHKNVDTSLDWDQIAGQPITMSFFVTNVTNAAYPTFDDLTGTSPGTISFGFNAPRMFGFKVRYAFGGR